MAPKRWFYLGPLGRMVALPCPEPGLENTLTKVAARHQSLSARTTEDIRGFRRAWTIEIPWLTQDDVGYLESCFTGVVRGPLRLLDPTRRNRLSLAASATSLAPQWTDGTRAVTATSGVLLSVVDQMGPDVAYTSRDGAATVYRPDTTLLWQLTGTTGRVSLDPGLGVVVVPGETVTASVHVRAPAGALVALALVPRTSAGDGTPVAGTGAVADTWTRVSVTYTVPAGVHSVVPQVTTTATTGNVLIAAAQVEDNAEPGRWVPGTGCPHVLITELPARSPVYPLVSAALELQEV